VLPVTLGTRELYGLWDDKDFPFCRWRDLAIKAFGPPRLERPLTLSRSGLNGLQPPGAKKVPTRGCDARHPGAVEVAYGGVADFTEALNTDFAEVESRESTCPGGGCRVCFLGQD
jgi:hypothetical protein